jgi:hypothetical protein
MEKAKFSDMRPLEDSEYWVNCTRCGRYGLDPLIVLTPPILDEGDAPFLSAATRQASERGRPLELNSSTNFSDLVVTQRSSTVSQKIETLLRVIALRCVRPVAMTVVESARDYPLADCQGEDEFGVYLVYLKQQGLLASQPTRDDKLACHPTINGWQELEPTLSAGGIPGRCFVAMSFDPSLDEAYSLGIKPAVEDLTFKAVCMKEIATNEGITDRILSEIRLAEFVVADFTGQRGGVYFEAGFARGLGREVIWSCRKDELNLVHFAIKHFGHVVWETPADLRTKLAESIRANIIPKR